MPVRVSAKSLKDISLEIVAEHVCDAKWSSLVPRVGDPTRQIQRLLKTFDELRKID